MTDQVLEECPETPSNITKEEYKAILKDCIEEVWNAHSKEWFIEPKEHFLQHQFLLNCSKESEEMKKNHEFVTELRKGTSLIKKVGVTAAVTTAVSAIVYWVYWHITHV